MPEKEQRPQHPTLPHCPGLDPLNSGLKFKVFSLLESIRCDPKCSKRVREHSAFAIAALIRFNKYVFASQVLTGPTIRALIAMAFAHSIQVLCSLIRSPLVDEIESNGEIPKIRSLLNWQELQVRVLAVDCVLEIGYYGPKEAVEAMLKEGLIKKLMELQRSKLGGDLIGIIGKRERLVLEVLRGRESHQKRFLNSHSFASCVARFAVQLEVGEGLRQRGKELLTLLPLLLRRCGCCGVHKNDKIVRSGLQCIMWLSKIFHIPIICLPKK
ncbi:hypothetical protein L6164_011450 [Bauhinia variegata]|uniref:Uncharacterized protein n=1 Tax=Bauhinia variegata TaxID=167791 RepID=A0ACB9P8K1_BAUVA|nr:hypothetical protein L6164_011450 [Bauhinia variegata]